MRVPAWVTERLRVWAQSTINSRPCNFAIGGRENPVWRRWYVFPRNNIGNIYIHEWLRSDDDRALHDHPWYSFSIHASGRMFEVYAPKDTDAADKSKHATRRIKVGDVTFRSAKFAHRIGLHEGERAISIFFRGPDIRNWGFWCPKGWRPWQMYARDNETTGKIGIGCGDA